MSVKDFLIDENRTMLEAMAQLDRNARKVLFVIRENKFVAAITDGDIRRWILRKGNLEAKVYEIANYSPKYLYENEKSFAIDFMKKHAIEALPILNIDNDIVSVVLWNDLEIEPIKEIGRAHV